MITVECECGKKCGDKFEVPESVYGEARAFEDVLISNSCPHRQLVEPYVVANYQLFSVYTTINQRLSAISG